MALRKISNLSLADQVFEQLTGEIMRGTYAPESFLPAERHLALTFDVNRHVVREALKRLEQLGLVHVAQGGGTRVLDFRRHAGLDLLVLLTAHSPGGSATIALWHSVLEARAAQARDIARLCAVRGSRELKQELVDIADKMQAETDDDALYQLELTFWDRAIEGAGNLVYRLAFNSLARAAEVLGDEAKRWALHELRTTKFRLQLAAAIADGNEAAAEAQVRIAMEASVDAIAALHNKQRERDPSPVPNRDPFNKRPPFPVPTPLKRKPRLQATPRAR